MDEIKNTTESFRSILEKEEETVSELEDGNFKITQLQGK
jgi:hypothetical protein